MGKNVGVLMFQFEYLNKQKMSGLTEFIDKFKGFLDSIDRKHTIGIEIRNSNYLKDSFFDFIRRNKLAMVFLQGYYVPPVWNVFISCREKIKSTAAKPQQKFPTY